MRDPVRFLRAALRHWGSIVTSGIFIGGVSLWQSTGHFVAHWIYWSIASIGLLIACYRAWLDERKHVVDLTTELGAKMAELKDESERATQLQREAVSIKEQSENENKKELVKAITLLRA